MNDLLVHDERIYPNLIARCNLCSVMVITGGLTIIYGYLVKKFGNKKYGKKLTMIGSAITLSGVVFSMCLER
jgi:hypothetical protein